MSICFFHLLTMYLSVRYWEMETLELILAVLVDPVIGCLVIFDDIYLSRDTV